MEKKTSKTESYCRCTLMEEIQGVAELTGITKGKDSGWRGISGVPNKIRKGREKKAERGMSGYGE